MLCSGVGSLPCAAAPGPPSDAWPACSSQVRGIFCSGTALHAVPAPTQPPLGLLHDCTRQNSSMAVQGLVMGCLTCAQVITTEPCAVPHAQKRASASPGTMKSITGVEGLPGYRERSSRDAKPMSTVIFGHSSSSCAKRRSRKVRDVKTWVLSKAGGKCVGSLGSPFHFYSTLIA